MSEQQKTCVECTQPFIECAIDLLCPKCRAERKKQWDAMTPEQQQKAFEEQCNMFADRIIKDEQ